LTRRSLHAWLALTLVVSLATLSAPLPAMGQDLEVEPDFAAEPIPVIWAQADSDSVRNDADRSWIWGPAIRSASHEPYVDSPDGQREVYYFDKARMEINDPDASWDSIWYATSGLLIREMMMGQIQVGDFERINTAPAEIPVTGDLENNSNSPTYATLGNLTVFGGQEQNRAEDRVGQPVNASLHADGSISTLANPPITAEVAYYDDTLGFNVPDVFWDWMNDQPIDWRYIIGHPVTEAYWVDTIIGGEDAVVMVQAFERRVLTFNPENESQWQVEAGNAGLHYRSWRDLSMPRDPRLHALAFAIPYGEIITEAAEKNGVDAYLLAGVAHAASNFNPKASLTSDRVGLMGVPLPMLERQGVQYPLDPTFNVRVAADLLALLYNQNGSWESAVEEYFNWQDVAGTFASPPTHATANAIAAWEEFETTYTGLPSPFGIDFDDYEPAPRTPPPLPSVNDEHPELPAEIPSLLEYYANQYDLDPNLVKAVAWQESRWNQNTISSSGAIGVMQVMPGTADWINDNLVEEELDVRGSVADNIKAGTAYLAHRIDQFDDIELGLAAYYMGPIVVQNNGITDEGRVYVDSVLSIRDHIATYGEPPR
jgi:soluble lytic murein transglycosylase-like protein